MFKALVKGLASKNQDLVVKNLTIRGDLESYHVSSGELDLLVSICNKSTNVYWMLDNKLGSYSPIMTLEKMHISDVIKIIQIKIKQLKPGDVSEVRKSP